MKGNGMKRLADRRTLLLAVAAAAVAQGAGAGTERPTGLEVTVGFEGGGFVPKGQLAIHLDGPEDRQTDAAPTLAASDGGSRQIRLSLALPPGLDRSPPQRVVARLQREDGWLLARGSAQIKAGSAVFITLYTVMH